MNIADPHTFSTCSRNRILYGISILVLVFAGVWAFVEVRQDISTKENERILDFLLWERNQVFDAMSDMVLLKAAPDYVPSKERDISLNDRKTDCRKHVTSYNAGLAKLEIDKLSEQHRAVLNMYPLTALDAAICG